jgi:hypothetical protein
LSKKSKDTGQVWWCIPIIPAVGKLRLYSETLSQTTPTKKRKEKKKKKNKGAGTKSLFG